VPQVPAVSGKNVERSDRSGRSDRSNVLNDPNVSNVFSPSGQLAGVLEGYEARDGQRRMAEAVADVIDNGGVLLAEAGTGTGKTLAYLAPAILSGRRVLVSTGTKNLQEQIFFKDLPLLQSALGVQFTATLMKGRSNYACLQRWDAYKDGVEGNTSAGGRLIDTGDRIFLPIIERWIAKTETGDRAELRDLPEDIPIWRDIAAEAESCLGVECPQYDACFVTRMRRRAAESDVVIVNHHLLCADASVRQSAYGEVIPTCATLVVDEAHQLEDVATQYFGYAISPFRVEDLVRDAQRILPEVRDQSELTRGLARAAEHARVFFSGLSLDPSLRTRAGTEARVRYTAEALAEHFQEGAALAGALEGLKGTLAAWRPEQPAQADLDDESEPAEALATLQRRAGELAQELRFLIRAGDPDYVYYVETRGRGVFLRASPVDVSRIVQGALFDRMRATILTSATLAVDGSFEYVKGRLGIREAEELRVPSEFDYRSQALLYLPRRLPSPKAPAFADAAGREVIELLKRSRGRAFVLFTSYSVLRVVQQLVELALPYPVLVQGTAPRTELIERFRTTPNAVLLATSSFWQGVDVVGEALSCVIIDKLPFASPSDPVTAARIEAINASGGDAFGDYQVPLAILALQQGLGRLIRHRTDRGVLAVLDPRLRTMGYGRRFLASLPPAPVTYELNAVEQFFV